ncbi:MAG: SDR family oxidoreductase [Bryobacterales bacterium]|nr:SDR family oxidoreductase [Bryobacterales bacterium]
MIVTGASGGIGSAIATMGASHGYRVCVHYFTNRRAAESIATSIRDRGSHAVAVQADVRQEGDVERLFDETASSLGEVTALVNNAAVLEKQMPMSGIDADRVQRIFATNFLGSFLCAKQAVRRMSTRNGGRGGAIVNISSVAATTGSPGEYVDYAASKAAVETMTIGLAREVALEGIRVNCVRPGFIYTAMHAKGGEPDRVDRVKSQVPMQRGGMPDEVAAAVLWLLSAEASYITGTILNVAGGR